MKSRTEYSILNILTGIGGFALNTIMGLICRIIFVRYLSADYLGANGLFTNVISMLSLAELGVGGAIVYSLYKPLAENDEKKIASLVKLYGKAYRIIGLVVGGIGLSLMPFLNIIIRTPPHIHESIYLLYAINLFNVASTYFFSYKSSLLVASQRNYIVSGLNYFITVLQSIIQMIALVLFRNYLVYLLIQTVGTFIYNIWVSKVAEKFFPYIKNKDIQPLSKAEITKITHNVRDLMVYKISGLLVNSTDNILITFFKGLSITGIASNYTLLVNTLASLLNQIFNGLIASVGNHNAIEENEKKYELFRFLNLMNFWIFGWASVGILFCSSDIVQFLFGKNYVLSIEIPLIMALNFYTVGLQNAVQTYKHTMGLFYYGRFIHLFTGILNIILSIILCQVCGLFVILIATLFARLLTNIWYDPYAVFKYGFHLSPIKYLKTYIHYILVMIITTIACGITFKYINLQVTFVMIIIKMIICSLISNVIFYLVFRNTHEFTKLCEIVKKMTLFITNKLKIL